MAEGNGNEGVARQLRTAQFVIGAMVTGLVVFLGIDVAMAWAIAPPVAGGVPILSIVALGFTALILVLYFVIPQMIVRNGRRAILRGTFRLHRARGLFGELVGEPAAEVGNRVKLAALFQTKLIAGAALLEGAAFFWLVLYFVEQSPLSLCAAIVLIVFLALQTPTRSRLIHWIEDQLRQLESERQFK
jgi:hypothetical protein